MLYVIRILKLFCLLMLLDGIWLVTMSERFYRHYLGYLFADTIQYSWAIVFYILYAIAVTHFIVVPSMGQAQASLINIFLEGFLFGFVVYSAYDLTNQATIKNWPLIVTIVDMLWGATLTGIIVVLAHRFIK